MATRYKTTGCARFFFFLLFFIPIVYFGLKYLDDRGQLDDWRAKVGLDGDQNSVDEILERSQSADSEFDVDQVKRQITELLSKIENQERIIKDQEETIRKQQELIEKLSDGNIQLQQNSNNGTQNSSKEGEPSLEELLHEADKALKKNND